MSSATAEPGAETLNSAMLAEYTNLEIRRRETDAELDNIKKRLKELETALLDQFAASDINSVKSNGLTVYIQRQLWASPADGDHERLCLALEASGHGDMVKTVVNSQTLSSFVRDHDKDGKELPADLKAAIKVSEVFSLRTRKS